MTGSDGSTGSVDRTGSGGRAEPAAAVLRVTGLDAWIGAQQILHGVSFEVASGGVTALLGRNGVGKTTTLRAVLGLVRRAGAVWLAGERIDAEPTHRIVRRGIGYVPENREVFGGLSVAENLELARRKDRTGGSGRDQLVAELFPDLVTRRPQAAGTLSGGQQQMLALARALLNDNLALLVDEPTKGLAPKVVDEVADALQVAARHVPILLVEQDLSVVSRLAAQVVVMAEGRVAHTGDAQQFLADPVAVRGLLGVSGTAAARAGKSS
jgi:branched-chain amino acid transport system ATP-binding protein